MILKKWLIGKPDQILRSSFIWNATASMINALQSTFILFVLQRLANEYVSGIFTITFATANLILLVGKFGVRSFQVSDIRHQYSFSNYCLHRIMTIGCMMVVTVTYCLFAYCCQGYTVDKISVCFWLCVLKMVDAAEDVIHGELQRVNRLDIAGRAMSLRLILTIAVLILAFCIRRNLSEAVFASAVFSTLFLVIITSNIREVLDKPRFRSGMKPAGKLLLDCFPLFINSFLLMFIINTPKYAIDHLLTDDIQAIYGFISLPLLVISLLAEFLFRPMIVSFSAEWNNRNYKAFCKRMIIITTVIGGLTAICVAGGVIVGIPMLSILFRFDLQPYWQPLAILLFGGGILSLSSFLAMLMTLIRKQKPVTYAFVFTSFISMPLAVWQVQKSGLLGAALAYLTTISVLCIFTVSLIGFYILRTVKGKEK